MNKNKSQSNFTLKKGNVVLLETPMYLKMSQEYQSIVGPITQVFHTYSRLFVFMGVENKIPMFSTYKDANNFNSIHLPNTMTGAPMTLNQIAKITEQVWDNRKDFRQKYKVKLGMYRFNCTVIQIIQDVGRTLTILRMSPHKPGVIFCESVNKLEWIDTKGKGYIPIPQAKRLTQVIEERTTRCNN